MYSRKMICVTALVLAAATFLPSSTGRRAQGQTTKANWLQWRGPNRDGKIDNPMWPSKLSGDRLKEQWRVELGPGYSGPIVTADRVFVTETADRKFEVVRALDRKTGKQIWEAKWEGSMTVPFFAKSNGDWIRATPACDGKRLYVAGMKDVLVCLNAETGEEVWRVDFVKELETSVPSFGFASSPLVHEDHVYVQAAGGFVKIDKLTGKIIWRVLVDGGGMNGSAFSSPYLAEIEGQLQLLVQTRTKLAAVDPEDGKVFWEQEVPAFRGMNIVTPTVSGNSVFTSSYGGGSFLFTSTKGEVWTVEQTWKHKAQGYMSSPIVIGNHLYLHLRNQRFTCIDLRTGEECWTTQPFGKYWSMVAAGDKILALDERGDLLLIRANPEEFTLLDSRKIADDSWAHLAVSGSEVFVRDLNAVVCYCWE